ARCISLTRAISGRLKLSRKPSTSSPSSSNAVHHVPTSWGANGFHDEGKPTMKAAVLNEHGSPCYGDFDEPSPQNGHSHVSVRAASVNAIDVALASGRHPFSPKVLPIVTGIEGVGVTQGRRVNFFGSAPPYGSMAQTTLVPDTNMFDVPDGLDDARAAALGNGGLAALMPLRDGAAMRPGERGPLLGATRTVGRLAVHSAPPPVPPPIV